MTFKALLQALRGGGVNLLTLKAILGIFIFKNKTKIVCPQNNSYLHFLKIEDGSHKLNKINKFNLHSYK